MARPISDFIIKEVLPAMRAFIAKKLVEVYGLSQKQAATKLGTTQPAISQYKRGIRGHKSFELISQTPALVEVLNTIAKNIATGNTMSDFDVTMELFKACQTLPMISNR